jgi:hypothetical protein
LFSRNLDRRQRQDRRTMLAVMGATLILCVVLGIALYLLNAQR